MLKRFCNKCKKEILGKEIFYIVEILEVENSDGDTFAPTYKKPLITLDICRDCMDTMLSDVEGKTDDNS